MDKQLKEIAAAELIQQIKKTGGTVIDIRKEAAFLAGSVPGALHIPYTAAEDDWDSDEETEGTTDFIRTVQDGIGKGTITIPVYVLCHTGNISREAAEDLNTAGIAAYSVKGGYRAYLAEMLTQAPKVPTRQQQIERSIIKKFRKQLWSRFTRAVSDYQLIQEGDKVAVCISGGKDSMLMAKLVQELHRHGNVHFDVVYLCMNPGYNEDNW